MTGRRSTVPTDNRLFLPAGFCACPVDIAFGVFGKKWTVLLMRNMLRGHRHFNQFLANIDGINPKTLSARLKDLEQEEIVVKRVATTAPITIEYELTEKGYAVLPILRQMVRWSIEYAPDKVFGNGKTPKEIERCVEEWQATIMPPDGTLLLERRGEVVATKAAPKKK